MTQPAENYNCYIELEPMLYTAQIERLQGKGYKIIEQAAGYTKLAAGGQETTVYNGIENAPTA